ncbi:hypothetical protein EGH22_06555 [Halomicroarcula sp. F28]|uniref:hypothetical protein n=1 Tax=Haloarcula salinisoli TaxID=2487746 RepID=UPI001C72FC88|nr:hypothetical protein [Halomicroarcula salinisoli]MBX0285980.1 hypothetical protein [Halomicroarcula salinisoli]
MQAGICGLVTGTFDRLSDVTDTVTRDGRDLTRSMTIDRVFSLPGGEMGFIGTAASERMTTRTATTIVDGEITDREEAVKETVRTRFCGVPGAFVVTESAAGTFVFELVGAATDTTVRRARLDLSGLFGAIDDSSCWKAGFYDRPDHAEKGTLYGENLMTDDTVESMLTDASLNQLGVVFTDSTDEIRADVTESGFVRLTRPGGLAVDEFLAILLERVRPHLETPSDGSPERRD